jgi:endonuclease/exonuclease/phosphatase family metal-dependent hydrolase
MTSLRTPDGHTVAPIQKKAEPNLIRVMSANVYFFAFSKLPHLDTPEARDAHADLAADTIASICPDVLLLQEMSAGSILDFHGQMIDIDWHGRLDPRLTSHGYREVPAALADLPKSSLDARNMNGVNYTPIWYRDELLCLVDFGHKYYDTVAMNPDAYLSSSKSYTWALFAEKATDKRFIAISTHLTWHGNPEKSLACRISDAREILVLLDELKERYPEAPVILMGDLNSSTDSEPYRLLTERLPNAKHQAAVTCNGHLSTWHPVGVLPNSGSPIDHALVSPAGLDIMLHQVLASENTVNMTDHFPVAVDLALL